MDGRINHWMHGRVGGWVGGWVGGSSDQASTHPRVGLWVSTGYYSTMHTHAHTHTLFARLLAAQLLVRSILLYESRKLCSGAPNAGLMAAWIGDIYINI